MAQQSHSIRVFFLNKGYQSFSAAKRWVSATPSFIFFFLFLFTSAILIDPSKITSFSLLKTVTKNQRITLNCINGNLTTCPSNYPTTPFKLDMTSTETCPEYFRWIHEDLKPWKNTGITRNMVEAARNISHFRLVILKGKVYVEKHRQVFQTRDVFTIWGILQLLRLYPGEVPDLELFFQCADKTVVNKGSFRGSPPPPVFHYSGRESAFDIVFPDWSFWGWAEIHIGPWEAILEAIQKGNKETKWKNRIPYGFWKGNPRVAYIRKQLCKCNVSGQHDWNARIYDINWKIERKNSYEGTKLEDQCNYRYKIYVEGVSWSHYWPISTQNMCQDIKFAVDWGNNHTDKAQEIGREGSNYIHEKLKMKFVYDYMFHLLQEYARLMRFEPAIPAGAVEVCSESLACSKRRGLRELMQQSMVTKSSAKLPCTLPPPYKPRELREFLQRKESSIKQMEMKNGEYFNSLNNAKH
ncbi:hypothetical protein L6164_003857 [Bauhinia variegata]|uniref:Uncharacterized protein n=1 Tax=Bauhinia variegata TaxID=167791 RepID=A0ACB9Q4L6_BAUVA|nr:hypothetical protein L6164_003857 [Bauhinia variegata]